MGTTAVWGVTHMPITPHPWSCKLAINSFVHVLESFLGSTLRALHRVSRGSQLSRKRDTRRGVPFRCKKTLRCMGLLRSGRACWDLQERCRRILTLERL